MESQADSLDGGEACIVPFAGSHRFEGGAGEASGISKRRVCDALAGTGLVGIHHFPQVDYNHGAFILVLTVQA